MHRYTKQGKGLSTEELIWIGRDGQRYGPYTEASIREWLAAGKLAPDVLAWRKGEANWVPVSVLLGATFAAPPPLPEPPLMASRPYSFFDVPATSGRADTRASFPRPPALHWFALFLLSLVTFGIFGWVWTFVQSTWVKRIDRDSKATLLFALGAAGYVLGVGFSRVYHVGMNPGVVFLGLLLMLGSAVVWIVAYFSMAGSLRRDAAQRGLPLEIGGITLFFFRGLYIQAQLSWLARWKDTGSTTPPAPKAMLWLLSVVPVFLLAILAAIAIPAYQDYTVRAQVYEGLQLADGAKGLVAAYYANHHAMPADNAAIGLPASIPMRGKYVSSVTIDDGSIVVAYDQQPAFPLIRDKQLVLTPSAQAGDVEWTCSGSMAQKYLPPACRR